MTLRTDAAKIIQSALLGAQPDFAVLQALSHLQLHPAGRLLVLAVGKAAWQMAQAAVKELGPKINQGLVITKSGHNRGPLPGFTCLEAGHPLPDNRTFTATEQALALVHNLSPHDTVLFLLSGGGSALFEKSPLSLEELQGITQQLLACGASITQINTIRKRLSLVKGGRFAMHCAPAHVFTIVLSDIIGDPLDMIASGPAFPDGSTCAEAQALVHRYQLHLSPAARELLTHETPKLLTNVETHITGNVKILARAAAAACTHLGYKTQILTTSMAGEARAAGKFLAALACTQPPYKQKLAYICGGETVVKVTGTGTGGRNQEIALSAAAGIAGLKDVVIFSFSSDGTDGPTDAAGGLVDGTTASLLTRAGYTIETALQNNDAYPALKAVDALIKTGPTGTNVNDLSILLCK